MADLNRDAKALVQAARDADRPSSADRARVLSALRGRLGDAAVLGVAVEQGLTPVRPRRGARTALGKWGFVAPALLVAGALWFAPHLWRGKASAVPALSASAPAAASQAPASSASSAAALSAPPIAEAGATATDTGASAATEARKPAARASDGLSAEVALLSRAETALRAGRPASALLALDEHQRKFPRGALAQERTAARIQALCALGRTADANAELVQLAQLSPDSPHRARAKEACESRSPP